jgi:hypothetical protein
MRSSVVNCGSVISNAIFQRHILRSQLRILVCQHIPGFYGGISEALQMRNSFASFRNFCSLIDSSPALSRRR